MKRIICFSVLISLLVSCTKEIELVESGDEPAIEFISLTPSEVESFKNSVTLTISYKDKNGDIGFTDPDQYALWVKDSRLDSADWYHIPPLNPPNSTLMIQGQLHIVLNSIFILGNGNQEVLSLAVKLRDRAGNWSNVLYTPSIIVKQP